MYRFKDYISDINRKSDQLQRDLYQHRQDWDSKLNHAQRRAEQMMQAQARGGKLDDLMAELRDREGALASLERQRLDLERAIDSDDHVQRDRQIQALRSDLNRVNKQYMDILAEKNRMYEEMTAHTKELLGLNATIHVSSVESAKLKQEVEFLRTEYEEKEKIIN